MTHRRWLGRVCLLPILVVGPLSSDRAFSSVTTSDGSWFQPPPPSARERTSAIYDPVRDRMIIFGGAGSTLNDMWALSFDSSNWIGIPAGEALPSGRAGHTAVHDPVRDRMLVFGGCGFPYCNDVWALGLSGTPSWNELAAAGTSPGGRDRHTAIYDPIRDRMIIFGGSGFGGYNDVWALSLSGVPTWAQIIPSGGPPPARSGHSAFYDPRRDRMLVFGGPDNAVWALSLSGSPAWSVIAVTGEAPSARTGFGAIYDPVGDRLIVHGGWDGAIRDDLWMLTLSGTPTWAPLIADGGPGGRASHSAIYDPTRRRMVVFAGYEAGAANDVWELTLTSEVAWGNVRGDAWPGGMQYHTATYDPTRERMVLYGGSGTFFVNDEVWVGSLGGSRQWSKLTPAATPPPPRLLHTAIHDPVRDRMIVFGGSVADTSAWALSFAGYPEWSQIAASGVAPTARRNHSAIYDPMRDRMILFGGAGNTSSLNEVWALSLSEPVTWTQLFPTGAPPGVRERHTAIYDPVRDRMLVFGGLYGVGPGYSYYNDVWALSLGGSPVWTRVIPAGSPPAPRWSHSAIYEPVGDRMVVYGGQDNDVVRGDVWALTLGAVPAWTPLTPGGGQPVPRARHTAIYYPVSQWMVVFGGDGVLHDKDELWAIDWGPPVTSVQGNVIGSSVELSLPYPNPGNGSVALDLLLDRPGPFSLALFDMTGRLVRLLVNGPMAEGRHRIVWDARDHRGSPVPSGVYLVRFAGLGTRIVRKAVVWRPS